MRRVPGVMKSRLWVGMIGSLMLVVSLMLVFSQGPSRNPQPPVQQVTPPPPKPAGEQADGAISRVAEQALPDSPPPGSAPEDWWSDEARLEELRRKWFGVHAWNASARVAEFAQRRAGSLSLEKTLELAGNLLEDYPLASEDFDAIPEHEKEAVSVTVQVSAHNRVKWGKNPFLSLGSEEAEALRADVTREPLDYPTSYLPDALGFRYSELSGEQKQRLAQLRLTYLIRLAPLVADATDRMTTAVHLAQQEGFLEGLHPILHLHLLDPSYPTLEREISLLQAALRDEVTRLLTE